MDYQNLRVTKLRQYLINVISELINNQNFQINTNFLDNEEDNYSLDKIPTDTQVRKWIIRTVKRKDVYSFRSRMNYSPSVIENLKNIGFFEKFEKLIYTNSKNHILPDIKGVESIECLNCGTMSNNETNTAEFDIQIQVTYREDL